MNITRIESRPAKADKFDFFVDFHGQVGDGNVNALLKELKGMTDRLLVLDEKEVRLLYDIIYVYYYANHLLYVNTCVMK